MPEQAMVNDATVDDSPPAWIQLELDYGLSPTPAEVGYGRADVLRITGVSYRQLDHWTRRGIVVPSVRPASGSGSRRLYSFRDLVAIRMLKRLTDAGVSPNNLGKAVQTLRRLGEDDLASSVLVTDGETVYCCRSDDEVIDLVRGGQAVIVIAVSGTVKELRTSLPAAVPVNLAARRARRPRRSQNAPTLPGIAVG
jgi:DNA-binding transcriptional MerR regulator